MLAKFELAKNLCESPVVLLSLPSQASTTPSILLELAEKNRSASLACP